MQRALASPPEIASEGDLVARVLEGDDDAYARLVRRHGGPLLATARRLLRNEEDARDAVQDAFIRAHQALRTFSGGSTLSTWLHRILINNCLMKLRSRRRKPEEPIDDLLPRFDDSGHQLSQNAPWEGSALDELCRRETSALVRRCIDRLPETYRTVLLLRDIQEIDVSEIAALLGVTENAVKIRVHRARQALRAHLDPYMRKGNA